MIKGIVDKEQIRIGMLGLTPGNGHPYSWSAIFNGYSAELMRSKCPFPGIQEYLGKQPAGALCIPDATVTHICCTGDGEFTAEDVAECTYIDHVVDTPEKLIDEVDAVIIATDIGDEHVQRAKPFVEAGVPIFIDKPMVNNLKDLAIFTDWINQGRAILSSSSMRYVKEYLPFRESTHNLGQLRYVSITMAKHWNTYAIHALEGVFPILGPGFISCRSTGTDDRNITEYTHACGADVIVAVRDDMMGGAGLLTVAGTHGGNQAHATDAFYSFKKQLEAFISYLRTGERPFPYSETEELMRMLIAGSMSREIGGKEVVISDL